MSSHQPVQHNKKEKEFGEFFDKKEKHQFHKELSGQNLKEYRETMREMAEGEEPEDHPSRLKHDKMEAHDEDFFKLEQAVNFVLHNYKSMTESQKKQLDKAIC